MNGKAKGYMPCMCVQETPSPKSASRQMSPLTWQHWGEKAWGSSSCSAYACMYGTEGKAWWQFFCHVLLCWVENEEWELWQATTDSHCPNLNAQMRRDRAGGHGFFHMPHSSQVNARQGSPRPAQSACPVPGLAGTEGNLLHRSCPCPVPPVPCSCLSCQWQAQQGNVLSPKVFT